MTQAISIGTQLLAPEGYLALESGVTYYFLRSDSAGFVLLVELVVRAPKKVKKKYKKDGKLLVREVNISPVPIPQLHVMSRADFEEGLESVSGTAHIVKAEVQATLPPWLSALEGLDLSKVDKLREGAKLSHAERMDRRVNVIEPLVRNAQQVLAAEDPDRLINDHARACVPKQNETRARLDFYVYMLFARNCYALHYPFHKIGNWCRETHPSQVKRGRPSRKGKGHGFNTSAAMIEKMIDCYRRESGPGVEMQTIYRTFVTKDLGCKAAPGRDGMLVFVHPKGEPFPTKETFRYHVNEQIGWKNVLRTLIGKVRMRSKVDVHRGSFSEAVSNVYERVERDAYNVAELPRGLIEGNTLKPVNVVRGRDVASGAVLGVGFAQGSETSEAYRAELFCRAICKVKFCSLFGIEITKEQWPSEGVSDFDVHDRGPGSTEQALAQDLAIRPVFREMTQSYSGQSKATVESANPKTRTADDAPQYFASSLRTFEIVRREIYRALKDNDSINIGSRIEPEWTGVVRKPSPNALYTELANRGRNSASLISFADAVRTYLTKLVAKVTRKGIMLHSQLFRSDELLSCGLLGRAHGPQEPDVEVYVLSACVRHIWVDYDGRLLELDIIVPVRVGNEVLYLSLDELREREAFIKARDLDFKEHRDATATMYERAFEEETGKPWRGGRHVAGRPKRGSKAAKQEEAEAKAAVSGKVPA